MLMGRVSSSRGMPDPPLQDSTLKCSQCARPLTYVRTMWCAFELKIDVWGCEPCQRADTLHRDEALSPSCPPAV